MSSVLNRIFVFVPAAEVESFKTGAGLTDAYASRIAFLSSTGEIMTNKMIFAVNKDADIQALQDLIGSMNNLDLGNNFDGTTIVSAIQYVYNLANTMNEGVDARLDVIEGTGEGSISKAVDDAISALINGAPDALDTLKEIADWISADNGQDAANLVNRMASLEEVVAENEEVTAAALIDINTRIAEITGGDTGSISSQITDAIDSLDSSVTLAGTTASQPQVITRTTYVDVLGGITVSEVDGLVDQSTSSYTVLQVDAAGAAQKAFDDLYGTDQDTINDYTLKGIRARSDWNTRTGSISINNLYTTTLSYDTSLGYLATVQNVADTINSINLWETFTSTPQEP